MFHVVNRLLFAALLLVLTVSHAAAAGLTIRLSDRVSETNLAGVPVTALERLATGSLVPRAVGATDAEGLVRFELDGLGAGRNYVVQASPYGELATSEVFSAPGGYRFWVGTLQLQVLDGTTGQPRPGQAVKLWRWSAGGNHEFVATRTADAEGWLRMNPPALGTDAYFITALSPTDGTEKASTPYWTKGPHNFVLGNAPVIVLLKGGATGEALPGMAVEAHELLGSGQRVFKTSRITGSDGVARFDLDGLSSGRRYVFSAQPFLHPVEITAGIPGEHVLLAGRLDLTVIDGRTGQAHAGKDLLLFEVLADGSEVGRGTFRSDAAGRLRLDPEGFEPRRYFLRAQSSSDGSYKRSDTYASSGRYTFQVGEKPLTIRLSDKVSASNLGGIELHAYEVLADGSESWRATRLTDAEGLARFDLEGLSSGRRFVVTGKPYGVYTRSQEFTAPGGYRFWVGKLQVRVLDGRSGEARVGQNVNVKRWRADGNHEQVMSATTDGTGWIRVDPPFESGEAYVVTATSAIDGREKVSTPFWTAGPHTFTLGNPPLIVTLRESVSNVPLSGIPVEIVETTETGNEVVRHKRWTDADGRVTMDLDGIGTGRRYHARAQPYSHRVRTPDFAAYGDVAMFAGELRVRVRDGRNGQAFAWRQVHMFEIVGTQEQARGSYTTNGEGLLRLDPEFAAGRVYILRTQSPSDGTYKTSARYAARGQYDFVVGAEPLLVRLIDHMSEAGVPGIDVHAYETVVGAPDKWVTSRRTDADGRATFDIDSLAEGRTIVLRANPYGSWVTGDPITTAGWYGFRVGSSPVRVVDAESGAAMPAVTVTAFEKNPDGSFRWAKQGVTSAQGTIRFDLEGVGQGRVYVLRASNPFGDGKDHESAVIAARGQIDFNLARDEARKTDRDPPSLAVLEPSDGARVSFAGLRLYGTAEDDEGILEVRVAIRLPSGREVTKQASWQANHGHWFVDTGRLDGELPGTINIVVTAVDRSWNEGSVAVAAELVVDTSPPVITVDARQGGSDVPTGGFVVSGRVADDTIGTTLSATVSGLSTGAGTRDIEVSQRTGRWSLVLAPEELANDGSSLSIGLLARDGAGNTATRSLTLRTADDYSRAWHVLQRASFGPTVAAYAATSPGGTGVQDWLQRQLAPIDEDDAGWLSRVTAWPNDGVNMATRMMRQATYSDHALREVMAWFWENHFNTFYTSHQNSQFERDENEAFRALALGNFRALLGASARSPAMLYTLDGRNNRKGRPNENYARELMELHTMGVDGGYTQKDVEEVARALTGWTVANGVFSFDAASHDTGAKTVLGVTIPSGGGESDGDVVLDILTAHLATARHICRKLVIHFVSDVPVDALVTRCAQTFSAQRNAPDQIRQVMWLILSSPEFLQADSRGAKIRTPLETVLAAVRQLGGEDAGDDLALEVQRQGMPIFMNPVPTGYSDRGTEWVSSGMVHARARFADRLLAYSPGSGQTRFDLANSMQIEGYDTAEGVCGRMLERLYGPTFLKRHFDLAMDVLTEGAVYPWLPGAANAETRLRRLGKALLVLPDYQYQ